MFDVHHMLAFRTALIFNTVTVQSESRIYLCLNITTPPPPSHTTKMNLHYIKIFVIRKRGVGFEN
jgi:hypothetical protein